ncbi:uncharacterized protein FA14DRAFT_152362 [Meira miltonrushii]|uniref:Cell wall protein n=1 Tax=Meira miltonrushii TaxID=1280837 RepID=A0A316VH68_9BASI|nr:uncharacterized protein FA14DRAFT_152362 [Meira miltonrushii]PWN36942.1 hypothetical protein FA14DRAFT_152362 [Meira miltonrushii]
MKFFTFFLTLIASVTLVCAAGSAPASFDSIKADLVAAQAGAKDFVKVSASTTVTANTVATVAATLKATSTAFIDVTAKASLFQGLFTSVQIDACLTLLSSISASINAGTKNLVQNKSTFKAIDDQNQISDQLAALDGSVSASVTALAVVFTANASEKVKAVGESISTDAYNACQAYGGKAC